MTYSETLEYLFTAAPMFQNVGAGAYKEGLTTTHALDRHFGHPHRSYRSIHVAGTNGKGSCSHTLAAILQEAGYKVGLYTSPHLVDFRERIRVNGVPINQQRVIDFVEQERAFFETLSPSFFELTTALALLYFAEEKVDFAVVEVGLGGRLDCTNIIVPELSIITNIGLDHTPLLGSTLDRIAYEKAGIIKQNVPIVVGQVLPETRSVFVQRASEQNAPLRFAEEEQVFLSPPLVNSSGTTTYCTVDWGVVEAELSGTYQQKNTATILTAIRCLPENVQTKLRVEHVVRGFAHVCLLTGLRGRWERIQDEPLVICDTGHNLDAWRWLSDQLNAFSPRQLHLVLGFCADKDVHAVLRLLPSHSKFYFSQPQVSRALPVEDLFNIAEGLGFKGEIFSCVSDAYHAALQNAQDLDVVFVGGSSFVVADLLTCLESS